MKSNVEIEDPTDEPTEDPGYEKRINGINEDVPVVGPEEDTQTTPIPTNYGQDTHEYKGKVRAWKPVGR